MNLSPHFTLAELTASAKAKAMGIDNTPPPELMPRLILLAEMLERIRASIGAPVVVTSGYRCQRLNLAVGGASTSDHPQGHAADIVAPAFGSATALAKHLSTRVGDLGIGQLILEGFRRPDGSRREWVHVSTHAPERAVNRIITITDAGVQAGIVDLLA